MADPLRRTCDFCQSEFDWTEDQLILDAQLRLMGSGLGDCCPACDEKQIQILIRADRLERRRERAADIRRIKAERANG